MEFNLPTERPSATAQESYFVYLRALDLTAAANRWRVQTFPDQPTPNFHNAAESACNLDIQHTRTKVDPLPCSKNGERTLSSSSSSSPTAKKRGIKAGHARTWSRGTKSLHPFPPPSILVQYIVMFLFCLGLVCIKSRLTQTSGYYADGWR